MKFLKNVKKYPFMVLLFISTIILTIIAYGRRNTIYEDYSVDLVKNPRLMVVFEGIKDKNYPWASVEIENKSKLDDTIMKDTIESTEKTRDNNTNNKASIINSNGSKKRHTDHSKKNKTGNQELETKEEDTRKDRIESNKSAYTDKTSDKSNTEKENNKKKKPTQSNPPNPPKKSEPSYKFTTVEEDYFDDALFIGDSRTVGLKDYSGWENPTFYADEGLTIYDVFKKQIAKVEGKKLTIGEALKKEKFKKIYIMLGINEMGTGNTKTFIQAYKEVLNQLEQLQPDAIIFVEAIMNVTKEKSDTDSIFNNKNIKDKNHHLAMLADNKKIFYIDVNEAITDGTGGIPKKYTFDNIHLKAAYYNIWTDFLLKHGVK